jgi:hypothetical protein
LRPEGLRKWKISLTPSGIEPATFRLLTRCLNQLPQQTNITFVCDVTPYSVVNKYKSSEGTGTFSFPRVQGAWRQPCSTKTSVPIAQTTRRHNQEDQNFQYNSVKLSTIVYRPDGISYYEPVYVRKVLKDRRTVATVTAWPLLASIY